MSVFSRFKSRHWLACLTLLSSLSSAAAQTVQVGAAPGDAEIAAINAHVSAAMRDLSIPGIALGIVHGDRIIHLRGFGVADETARPVTPQTPFRIGSITKSFTALAVMQLVEAGKLELDASVRRYLPWFRLADEAASAQMSVRHLLNQTSGLSTPAGNAFWDSQDGLEANVRRLHTVMPSQPVGTGFQYSNINYSIAGLLIEVASGQPFADYIAQHIFGPLAMRHSHATVAAAQADGVALGHLYSIGRMVPDMGAAPPAYQPAGFLSASAEDMAHYAIAQLNGGRYGEQRILSEQGITQMHYAAVPLGALQSATPNTHYGMGWVIGPTNDVPTVWHNGDTGRFHATLILAPERGLGIVLLANASGLEHLVAVDETARGVLSLLTGRSPAASPSNRIVFRFVYWVLLLFPVLLLVGIARGWQRWRRGDFDPRFDQVRGQRKRVRRILWMVIPNLAAALFFMFAMPQLTGLPLSGFRILYPDLGAAWMAVMIIGIGWSVIYTVLVARSPRGRPTP
ncbi:MAG: serine hydrolase domain-containing protein [Burkholderiales bacterium]